MALQDRSIGPFYLTRYPLPQRWCRPFIGGVRQTVRPWRRGKAIFFPSGPFRSTWAVGLWFRLPKRHYVAEYEDEQWICPPELAKLGAPRDLTHLNWSSGPDVQEEATTQ